MKGYSCVNAIASIDRPDRATFEALKAEGRPVILKGIAADWPIVAASKTSSQALADYLLRYSSEQLLDISICPPALKGHFFYNDDLSGLNYRTVKQSLRYVIQWCLANAHRSDAEAIYVQAQWIDSLVPGLGGEIPMPLLDAQVRPRLWLGNTLRTQTHFDYAPNIAVHVAGQKTFTLFAPDQTANLYPGPLDQTPAGVPISMVSMEAPDFQRFPRFADALKQAITAELEPGDGLYIPALWWHHVQTTGPLNILINYWWNEVRADLVNPITALRVAALAYKDMPQDTRTAWRELMAYFVFEEDGDPVAHLPEKAQGVFQKDMPPQLLAKYKTQLLR